MNKIKADSYRVEKPVKLTELSTTENFGASKKELKKALKSIRKDLGDFQNVLYAHRKYGVLICIQGMDTSGKDSLIREVFKDFNVRGVVAHSFKAPNGLELKHDYLWRHYVALPERGKFSIFNRTHYENVLVSKVHPDYVVSENIPGINSVADIGHVFWQQRYRQLNDFERHIAENGTLIFKFFLNISKEEQRQRLLRRLRRKDKNWKFSPDDLQERKLWDNYQECYEEAINHTSKPHAPWYIVPADNKKAARVIVASVLLQKLTTYQHIKEPELDKKIKADLDSFKQQLQQEAE